MYEIVVPDDWVKSYLEEEVKSTCFCQNIHMDFHQNSNMVFLSSDKILSKSIHNVLS